MSDFIRQGQEWVFNDGTRLPVVSGGSDTGVTETPTGTAEPTETVDTGETVEPVDYSGYSEFVQGLLKEAPEEHQKLLEPYIKKWDAGVTRRFSELQGKLKPYEEFGDIETIQEAVTLYQALQDDEQAKAFYQSLHEYFNPQGQQQTVANAPAIPGVEDDEFQELPPAIVAQLQRQDQILQALAQHVLGQQQAEQEANEDAELDHTLNQLKAEFGDFDEDYVLAKMHAGMDAAKAVQSYTAMMQQRLATYTQTQKTPPTLSGGGSVPAESQNLAKIPNKDLKNFVADLLKSQAEQS